LIRRLFPDGFPPPEPAPSGSWRSALLAAFGLAVLMVFLYWPAVDFRLLSFDDQYYTQNALVSEGLNDANIVRVFTELPEEDLFIPLTRLSFMVDVELFGMAPRGFHFTNIVLHAIDMALLLLVLWRMTGSLGKSALAAALVAFHPLRVESVAWVTERKDVLSVFFLLLSLSCYLRYARTRKMGWHVAVLFCCALGMLAKPMLVTLPFLLLLMDFWPLGRFREEAGEGPPPSFGRRLLALAAEKIPLAAISVLASLATLYVKQKSGLHRGVSIASRLEHSFSADFIYLYQTVWPRDLVFRFFRQPWDQYSGTLIPAAAVLAIISVIVVRSSGRRPYVAFGWFWYLVALFPVSGIVPTGIQWISDRFTYVPHVGLAVALVWLAAGIPARRWSLALPALAVILLLSLAILSRRQLYYWKDGVTMLGRGMEHSRQDPGYVGVYVRELINTGDLLRAREQQEQILRFAMDPYDGANIQKQYLEILDKLGDRTGAIAKAIEFLRQDPAFWRTRLHLADDLLAEGRFADAAAEFRRVLDVKTIPSYDREYALEGAGLSLWRMGMTEEALTSFNEGLKANPSNVSLRYNLARLLADRGDAGNARAQYEEALRIAPGNVRVRLALADLLIKMENVDAATFHYQEVSRSVPGNAEAIYAQARILESAGMKSQAWSLYASALKAPTLLTETAETVRKRMEAVP
jgi:tetratricopeptide (TPR) repeat protein